MSTYSSIPALTRRQKLRRLPWIALFLVLWGSVLVVIPALFLWVRNLPPITSPLAILVLWGYLFFAYSVTILRVEINDEFVEIASRSHTKRIPAGSIADVMTVRTRGKLKRIRLYDRSTHPIGTIYVVRGSRRLKRAEELLQELTALSEVNSAMPA